MGGGGFCVPFLWNFFCCIPFFSPVVSRPSREGCQFTCLSLRLVALLRSCHITCCVQPADNLKPGTLGLAFWRESALSLSLFLASSSSFWFAPTVQVVLYHFFFTILTRIFFFFVVVPLILSAYIPVRSDIWCQAGHAHEPTGHGPILFPFFLFCLFLNYGYFTTFKTQQDSLNLVLTWLHLLSLFCWCCCVILYSLFSSLKHLTNQITNCPATDTMGTNSIGMHTFKQSHKNTTVSLIFFFFFIIFLFIVFSFLFALLFFCFLLKFCENFFFFFSIFTDRLKIWREFKTA